MNVLSAEVFAKIVPGLKARCPRLTELDLFETQHRIDLIVAKIQNRHWISRVEARRIVLEQLAGAGVQVV